MLVDVLPHRAHDPHVQPAQPFVVVGAHLRLGQAQLTRDLGQGVLALVGGVAHGVGDHVHAGEIIADDEVILSSYNLTNRSRTHDHEVGVRTKDPEFVNAIAKIMDEQVKVQVPVSCIEPGKRPQRPALRDDDELLAMDEYRRTLATWAERLRLKAYADEAEAVIEGCSRIPAGSRPP